MASPNIFLYNSRWQLFVGEFNYQTAGPWDNAYFKWYTFRTGMELLEENGFTIIVKTVTGRLPANSFFSRILSNNISAAFYNLLIKISPGLFGYQLLYTAKPTSR